MSVDQIEGVPSINVIEDEAEPHRSRSFTEPASIQERARPRLNPTMAEVLAMIRATRPSSKRQENTKRNRGGRRVLNWLLEHPGETWQERWESSGADDGTDWIQQLVDASGLSAKVVRSEIVAALVRMFLRRLIYPGYDFLNSYFSHNLLRFMREEVTPELFTKLEAAATEIGMHTGHKTDGIRVITKIVLHTGKRVDEIAADDLHAYREWNHRTKSKMERGVPAAWDMLRKIGIIEDVPLRTNRRLGPQPSHEIVDFYGVKNPDMRTLFIRYLDERRPAMDYSSVRSLAFILVKLFWRDIERHHPEQKDLRLPNEVAEAWRERVRFRKHQPGREPQTRKDVIGTLTTVRAFYLDLQEWALEDPVLGDLGRAQPGPPQRHRRPSQP